MNCLFSCYISYKKVDNKKIPFDNHVLKIIKEDKIRKN